MEIHGRFSTAVCYAKVIEDEAINQIRRMCDYPFTEGAKIRIMPDVHAGKACTIGTTMTITDKAVPNLVGVDIGCGMYTVNLGRAEIDLARFDEAAHTIPSGFDVWDRRQEYFDLSCLRYNLGIKDSRRVECSLGTLGGGNHFIEIDRTKDGTNYLVIHSGSRSLGRHVAQYYQQLAIIFQQWKSEYISRRNELISTYKEQGRQQEIQAALEALRAEVHEEMIPEDLCYLEGENLDSYIHDIKICQDFARRNREKIAEVLLKMTGLAGSEGFHTVHNYIDTDEMILRKGAIAAHEGELVLIPINMRDGSVFARGKGNPEWNYSAPHGAGRIMSRNRAKEELNLEEYRAAMQGVYTTSVSAGTLDEAPMAYKSLDDIIDVIADSVEIIEVMKPVYNFKAG